MTIRSLTTAVSRLSSAVRRRGPPPVLFSLTPMVTNNVFDGSKRRFISTTKATLMTSKESPEFNPGLHTTIDNATKGYFVQQTMYRIKDPKATLDFYSRVLGMSLIKRLDWPDMKVSLYFMAYEDLSSAPTDPIERTKWMVGRRATLELAHYWEDVKAPEFKGYHNGNADPVGYGHIGITVDDVYKACERFESLGVEFVKKPTEGDIKGVAFIKDPDGYWIEIFDQARVGEIIANAGAA